MIADRALTELSSWSHLLQYGMIVFGVGGAWAMLRQLRREVSRLWEKFDKLDKREQAQNMQTAIALTALATGGNPHGREKALEAVQKMIRGNAGNG